MELTYTIIIAIGGGLLVFSIMKTMTKWMFRIIIALLFIAGLFYMYIHVDDIKAVYSAELKNPVVANATEPNITAEQAELPRDSQKGAGAVEYPAEQAD